MSATGLDVFDKTLQTTNIWLNEISDAIGPDKQVAWKVLSTVLHKLRDRLPIEVSAHLGTQLPLLIRGVYYDQFEPGKQHKPCHTAGEFSAEVAKWLTDMRPVDPDAAIAAVFSVLSRHISEGQITKIKHVLPKGMRAAWKDVDAQAPPMAEPAIG